jgi:uncharacterized protein DUF481
MKRIILLSLLVLLPIIGHATTIKLSSGDEINAEILERTDTYIRVKHSVLGVLTIRKEQVIAITDNEDRTAEPELIIADATNTIEEDKDPTDHGMFGFDFVFPNFDRSFSLGVKGSNDESSEIDIYTAFDADYEDDYKRWDIGFRSDYSKDGGTSTDNDFRVFVNRDWLNPDSDWRYFAKGQYDWDQFKSWDNRLTGIVGPGYRFIKNDFLELIGRTGLSLKKEYGSDNDDLVTELMVGFNSDWKLAKFHTVKFGTEFFSPFDDFGEIRNLSHLDWIYKLTDEGSDRDLSLKVTMDYEYDWEVDPGDSHDELIYRTSLVLGL